MSLDQHDEKDVYPHFKEGMKLPEGVFPPMEGYTHEDIIDGACNQVYKFLVDHGIDQTLARESIFILAAHINAKFEEEEVEYKLATYYKKPYKSDQQRRGNVEAMAEDFGAMARNAAIRSLEGSPLLGMNEGF